MVWSWVRRHSLSIILHASWILSYSNKIARNSVLPIISVACLTEYLGTYKSLPALLQKKRYKLVLTIIWVACLTTTWKRKLATWRRARSGREKGDELIIGVWIWHRQITDFYFTFIFPVVNIVRNRYPQDPAPQPADLLDPMRTGRVWPLLLRGATNYWLVSGQPWWLLDWGLAGSSVARKCSRPKMVEISICNIFIFGIFCYYF
jgi:hypothetical protein